jgi:hypothetical protein
MSETVMPRLGAWDANAAARSALRRSAIVWFVPALIGQWLFAYHIAADFIGPALAGNIAIWNKSLYAGLIAGDLVGNTALAAHLFVAFVMTIGGSLQLIPQIRAYAPAFHRWNGRLRGDRDTARHGSQDRRASPVGAAHIHRGERRLVHARHVRFPERPAGTDARLDGRHDRSDQHRDRIRELSAAARGPRTLFPRPARPERGRQFAAAAVVLAAAVVTTVGVYGKALGWLS